LLTRFATHPDGRLRAARLLGIAFVGGLVVALGTTAAIVLADAGSPSTLSIWVIVAFLGVKLPLLGLLWWVLGRRQRDDALTEDQLTLMIDRIEARADAAFRTRDTRDRLEILRDEAGFVRERASGDLRERAERLVRRLESMAQSDPGR
jgi:hypothetical protein